MAATRLTDVIIPEIYMSYQAVNSPEKTAVFTSGIVTRSGLLDSLAVDGGNTFNIPFWKDIESGIVPNLGTDNPADLAVANKLATAKQVGRAAYLNQWFSNADLTSELAGSDANRQVRNRFGSYWTKQWQKRLLATTVGIIASNKVNNSGDMVKDVASNSISGQSASTKFNRDAFTDAVYSMGDAASELGAMVVHSAVMAQMVKNDDIVYIPDSMGSLSVPTYMGVRVIVDDSATVTAGTTDGFKYNTLIFGQGVFGYGEGSPLYPVETKREALQGNGAGVEYIGERKTWLLHPFGFKDVGTPTGLSYSIAELATGANWERVVERKSVPFACLVTN
jgi:hypothetical protein